VPLLRLTSTQFKPRVDAKICSAIESPLEAQSQFRVADKADAEDCSSNHANNCTELALQGTPASALQSLAWRSSLSPSLAYRAHMQGKLTEWIERMICKIKAETALPALHCRSHNDMDTRNESMIAMFYSHCFWTTYVFSIDRPYR
jgi:hypothetical protein